MIDFRWIPFFAGVFNLFLAVLILSRAFSDRRHQVVAAMCLGVAGWNIGVYGLHVADESVALSVARLTWLCISMLPVVFLHVALTVSEEAAYRRFLYGCYAASLVFAGVVYTDWSVLGMTWVNEAWYARPGPMLVLFACVYFPIPIVASCWVLWGKARDGTALGARCRAILVINMIMGLTGFNDMLPVLGFEQYPWVGLEIRPWGSLAACFYSLVLAYSVLTDQILRLRLLIGERLAGAMRLLFFAAVVFLLMLAGNVLMPTVVSAGSMLMAIVCAVGAVIVCTRFFPRLLGGFTDSAQRIFFLDSFDYREKLQAFTERMTLVPGFTELSQETLQVVVESLGCDVGAIFVGGRSGMESSLGYAHDKQGFRRWEGAAVFNVVRERKEHATHFRVADLFGDEAGLAGLPGLRWVFPIRMAGSPVIGVLAIGTRSNWPFVQSDLDAIDRLVRALAFQIERFHVAEAGQLRAASEAKDRFLSSINHEMRNPLNGIVGIIDIFASASLPPRERFLLSNLRACADRLGATIDDVLDFANVDAGAVTLNESTISLAELVSSTCSNYPQDRVRIDAMPDPSLLIRGFRKTTAGFV